MNRFWSQLAIATNWPVLVAVAVLCSIGILSIHAHPSGTVDAQKQSMFLVVGVVLMFVMQGASYVHLCRYAWPFYVLSLLLLIYTIMPGVPTGGFLGVPEVNGAKAWINTVGPF